MCFYKQDLRCLHCFACTALGRWLVEPISIFQNKRYFKRLLLIACNKNQMKNHLFNMCFGSVIRIAQRNAITHNAHKKTLSHQNPHTSVLCRSPVLRGGPHPICPGALMASPMANCSLEEGSQSSQHGSHVRKFRRIHHPRSSSHPTTADVFRGSRYNIRGAQLGNGTKDMRAVRFQGEYRRSPFVQFPHMTTAGPKIPPPPCFVSRLSCGTSYNASNHYPAVRATDIN